ncbi:hypothetical protein AYI69_g6786, partial [Smittium culicis]
MPGPSIIVDQNMFLDPGVGGDDGRDQAAADGRGSADADHGVDPVLLQRVHSDETAVPARPQVQEHAASGHQHGRHGRDVGQLAE